MSAGAFGPGPARMRGGTRPTVPMPDELLNEKISTKEKRALRARAHHLNPVVSIGAAGLSDAVLAELEVALESHELVKLRVAADDRVQRKALIDDLCRRAKAELIQRIGHMAVIYRERPGD
jgi:RNA-binding protein